MELTLVHKIYKDSDMAIETLKTLEKELKKYSEEMLETVIHIRKGYERYKKKASDILKKEKLGLDKVGEVTKMMADTGVKRKIKHRHSESGVASMLIKGLHMGVKDMDHELDCLKDDVDKKSVELARDFLVFQKDNITALKPYL